MTFRGFSIGSPGSDRLLGLYHILYMLLTPGEKLLVDLVHDGRMPSISGDFEKQFFYQPATKEIKMDRFSFRRSSSILPGLGNRVMT